jgi:hypothetical protein
MKNERLRRKKEEMKRVKKERMPKEISIDNKNKEMRNKKMKQR